MKYGVGEGAEIYGDGKQTRSFLYIDECIEAIRRLMASDHPEPINIGSDEKISMNDFVAMISDIAGTPVKIRYSPGPTGVRGRNSENTQIKRVLGWAPDYSLRKGMEKAYAWVEEQVKKNIKNSDSRNQD